MGSSSLKIAGRTIVTTSGAAFNVEYGLFDAGEISLGRNALGRPIEHGYSTTAADAIHRLSQLGATPHLAQTCADVMHPTLVEGYARGGMVRKLATLLDTQLVFESMSYDGATASYVGTFLDLASLANDLGRPGASALFQALYLSVVLAGVDRNATVELDTQELTAALKPGERTHHRVSLEGLSDLPALLQDLANRGGGRGARGAALERDELLALLDARALPGTDLSAYRTALDVRDVPAKGPLARADLWEIELMLDAGDYPTAVEKVEQAERTAGRTPATAYLRARCDLLAGTEDPAVLAPRLSALALSMSSFVELGLLAGEAWMAAGDERRARAYANDVVATKGIDSTLRERASSVLRGAVRPPTPAKARPARPQPIATNRNEPKSPSFFPDPRAEPERHASPAARRPEDLDSGPRRPSYSGLVRTAAPSSPDVASTPTSGRMPVAASAPTSGRMPVAASAPQAQPVAPARPQPPPSTPAVVPPPAGPEPPSSPALAAQPASSRPFAAAVAAPAQPPSNRPFVAASAVAAAQPPSNRPFVAAPAQPPSSPPFVAAVARPAPSPSSSPPFVPAPPSSRPPFVPPPSEPVRDELAPPPSSPVIVPVSPPSDPAWIAGPADQEIDEVTLPPNTKAADSEPPSSPTLVAIAPAAALDASAAFPDDTPPPYVGAGGLLAAIALANAQAAAARAPHEDVVASTSTEDALAPADLQEHTLGDPFRPVEVPFPSSFPAELSTEGRVESTISELEPPPSETPTPTLSGEFVRGATRPPSLEGEPATISYSKAPLFPRSDPDGAELAVDLPLPASIGAATLVDALPTSVLEARIQNTLLSRELGLRYRTKRNVELRADLSGIEYMQAYLYRRFEGGIVDGPEGARDVQLHGAFLSEILARRLDAEWIDISADHVGHWEMVVPPGTRVWPFGRVSRLIVKGHRERDLVAYFLELQAKRARAR